MDKLRAGRLILRLDDLCRDLTPILAGALPALVLAGVLITGGGPPPDAREESPEARCHATGEQPAHLGPDVYAYLCHGDALQRAADGTARERSEREGSVAQRTPDNGAALSTGPEPHRP